jgi:hypothetical protein
MKGGIVGTRDNALKVGDVAIMGHGPTNCKTLKDGMKSADFKYIKVNGKLHKVADVCNIPNNIDFYIGVRQ